ncbi:MAG TPA: hypothetical protein VK570_15615 [Rubrivivax sp.]|nr:hypothetical protein [Rubrivivax sp.]
MSLPDAQDPSRASTVANAEAPRRWPTWMRRGRLELVACGVITLGILMMLQPFALELFTWSFVTTLAGTVMFMIVSKFPE